MYETEAASHVHQFHKVTSQPLHVPPPAPPLPSRPAPPAKVPQQQPVRDLPHAVRTVRSSDPVPHALGHIAVPQHAKPRASRGRRLPGSFPEDAADGGWERDSE